MPCNPPHSHQRGLCYVQKKTSILMPFPVEPSIPFRLLRPLRSGSKLSASWSVLASISSSNSDSDSSFFIFLIVLEKLNSQTVRHKPTVLALRPMDWSMTLFVVGHLHELNYSFLGNLYDSSSPVMLNGLQFL